MFVHCCFFTVQQRTPNMLLSGIRIRNLKPKEKAYMVSDFGFFCFVQGN